MNTITATKIIKEEIKLNVGTKVIYTVITGKKDILNENINSEGAKLVCFTDKPMESKNWEIRILPDLFKDVRRNSRIAKMLPHIFLPDAEYSLYIDGNVGLKIPLQELIDDWLKETDIACFHHMTRDCYYDEAKECNRLGLDDKETIIQQLIRYYPFPKHKGLYQGGVILRRHTKEVEKFNEAWFAEYCCGSKRDQISFPIAIMRTGLKINANIGHAYYDKRFTFIHHAILSEWAGKI